MMVTDYSPSILQRLGIIPIISESLVIEKARERIRDLGDVNVTLRRGYAGVRPYVEKLPARIAAEKMSSNLDFTEGRYSVFIRPFRSTKHVLELSWENRTGNLVHVVCVEY